MLNSKSKIFASTVFVLLILLTSTPPVEAKYNVLTVPGDYPTIQAAVDAANPRDTIIVHEGTYPEMVTISKPLTVIGRDATVETPGLYGFSIQAPATVSGFKIRPIENGLAHNAGIQFESTSYYGGVASNNEIFSGFSSSGIAVNGPSGITVKNNKVHSSGSGVSSSEVSDITITGNVIDSVAHGIVISGPNTVITNNIINSGPNGAGICVYGKYNNQEQGGSLVLNNNKVVAENYGADIIFTSRCIITENRIEAGNGGICVAIAQSSNVILRGNTLVNPVAQGRGLDMSGCDNVLVSGNKISVVEWGITFGALTSAIITGNEITVGPKIIDDVHYGTYGIVFGGSSNCVISNNLIRGAQYASIWSYSSHDVVIKNNAMTSENTGSILGIRLANDVSKFYVSENIITGAYYYGIGLDTGSNTNTIFRNTITITGNPTGAGIILSLDTFGNLVKNNRISGVNVAIQDDSGLNTIIP